MAKVFGVPVGVSWHKAQCVRRVAALREEFRLRLKRTGDWRRLLQVREAQWRRIELVEADSHLLPTDRCSHLLSAYGIASNRRSAAPLASQSLGGTRLPTCSKAVAATFGRSGVQRRSARQNHAATLRGALSTRRSTGRLRVGSHHAFAGDPTTRPGPRAQGHPRPAPLDAGDRLHSARAAGYAAPIGSSHKRERAALWGFRSVTGRVAVTRSVAMRSRPRASWSKSRF